MSSLSIDSAQSLYGGANQAETLRNMAAKLDCSRIYSYRNNFQPWWRWYHTDYFRVERPGDEERISQIPGTALVYDCGEVHLWRQYVGIAVRVIAILVLLLVLLTPLAWLLR